MLGINGECRKNVLLQIIYSYDNSKIYSTRNTIVFLYKFEEREIVCHAIVIEEIRDMFQAGIRLF